MPNYRSALFILAPVGLASLIFLNAAADPRQAADDSTATSATQVFDTPSSTDKGDTDKGAATEGQKADDRETEQSIDRFMRQKLGATKRILKGLMTNDLKLVEDNADQLLKMSHEEKWIASNDMMYLQHSIKFRNAAEDLYSSAADNSMDGASLAWVKVTMSCIKCHEWVRDTMLADLTKPTLWAMRSN